MPEAALAAPDDRRVVVLTLAAATVTVAAVAVIFLVPVLNECRGRDGDVFACLRQQAAELVPSAGTPPASQPSADAPSDPVAPEPSDPAPIALRPEVEALNVSPDGTIVISGSGPPGADIPVYADGELFGTATAEPDGGWTLAVDKPLPPGGTAIVVGDIGGDALAEQGFVVVVDPAQQAHPEVLEGTPDELASLLLDVAPALNELPPGGQPDVTETAEVPPAAAPTDQTGTIVVGQAADVAPAETQETDGEPISDAAERVAQDVAEALADPRDVAPVSEPETAEVAHDAPELVAPSAAERAAREAAEALASPRDVAPVAPTEPMPPVKSAGSAVAMPSAAERAALEVATALASPENVAVQPEAAQPNAAPAPQDEVTAGNELPSAAARAAHEVRQALARQRDVAPVPVDTPAIETAEPPMGTAERAAEEAAAALEAPRDVLPPPVSPADLVEEGLDDLTLPAAEVAADILSPAAERAAQEVREALNRQRDVSSVPVAAPAPPAEDVADNEDTGGNAAERAAEEAATALANPQDIAPVAQPAPQVASPVERARLEVLAALEAAARMGAALPVPDDDLETADAPATVPDEGAEGAEDTATAPDAMPIEPDDGVSDEPPAVDPSASDALAAIEAALTPPADGPGPLDPEPAVDEPAVSADEAAAPAPAVKPPVEGLILPVLPDPRSLADDTAAETVEPTAPSPVPADVAGRPQEPVTAPPIPQADPRPAPEVQLTLVDADELARGAPGTYVVRRGDTLWDIARRVYGNGARYRTIYRANRHLLRHPGRIRPGQVLEIPLVYD